MNIEKGKYWDEACNPIVTDRCTCEVVNCWAKDMLRRFPTLNPSPDENGVGWYPGRLNKISLTGPPKVYAMCWLGDIGWPGIPSEYIHRIINEIREIQKARVQYYLPGHTFLFLTKYPSRIYKELCGVDKIDGVYWGTSATDMKSYEKRIATLVDLHWDLWLSIEPLIDIVTLNDCYSVDCLNGIGIHPEGDPEDGECVAVQHPTNKLSQVIVGAETGTNARPCNLDWIRSLRDQCGEAGVPFFVKQVDAKRNRELDGQLHNALAWRK